MNRQTCTLKVKKFELIGQHKILSQSNFIEGGVKYTPPVTDRVKALCLQIANKVNKILIKLITLCNSIEMQKSFKTMETGS